MLELVKWWFDDNFNGKLVKIFKLINYYNA